VLKNLFLFLLLSCNSLFCLALSIDPITLGKEIAQLNDQHHYENAILRLEEVLNDTRSSAADRFHAYLQKSYTYKRIYNYTGALHNLDLALAEIKKEPQMRNEIESRVLIERLFIYFDLQKEKEFQQLLKEVSAETLTFVTPVAKAFYWSILATLARREQHFAKAENYLDQAIRLVEYHDPKHLPNIYRAKVALYGDMNDPTQAIHAFNTGLSYARKYKMDRYIIIMYESITHYYKEKGDYKNAFTYQLKVSEERSKYNAHNSSGNLNVLEKKLLEKRKDAQIDLEKTKRHYLGIIACCLSLLVLVVIRLLLVSKQKAQMIEKENERIRTEIIQFSTLYNREDSAKLSDKTTLFSARQLEIIHLVIQGKTNKEIGNTLFISENTVKYHLKAIYDLLGVANRTHLKVKFGNL